MTDIEFLTVPEFAKAIRTSRAWVYGKVKEFKR
jgi:predicted DNA-binding transcriptional regulator AlpA